MRRPRCTLVGLFRAKLQENIFLVGHLCKQGADLIHPLFSGTLQNLSIGGCQPFTFAEVDCPLKLRQLLF